MCVCTRQEEVGGTGASFFQSLLGSIDVFVYIPFVFFCLYIYICIYMYMYSPR